MKNFVDMLPQTALFNGFTPEEAVSALLCLDGQLCRFARRQVIYREDEPMQSVGLVLSGAVNVSKEDATGQQAILFEAARGDIIGEISLQQSEEPFPRRGIPCGQSFSVTAAENCEILFLHTDKIIQADRTRVVCALRGRVIENLLQLIVANNRGLYRKLDLVSHRSLRSRILHYLELQAKRNGSSTFTIPFDRTEFADYLMVNRSALSRELCRMADDGLIAFSRNRFELLQRYNKSPCDSSS